MFTGADPTTFEAYEVLVKVKKVSNMKVYRMFSYVCHYQH